MAKKPTRSASCKSARVISEIAFTTVFAYWLIFALRLRDIAPMRRGFAASFAPMPPHFGGCQRCRPSHGQLFMFSTTPILPAIKNDNFLAGAREAKRKCSDDSDSASDMASHFRLCQILFCHREEKSRASHTICLPGDSLEISRLLSADFILSRRAMRLFLEVAARGKTILLRFHFT